MASLFRIKTKVDSLEALLSDSLLTFQCCCLATMAAAVCGCFCGMPSLYYDSPSDNDESGSEMYHCKDSSSCVEDSYFYSNFCCN